MSQYQKGKTNLGFTKARDSEWHQLGRMQVCTSLQTDNYASTPPLSFYGPDALPVIHLTASKHWRRTSFTHNAFVMSISILARGSFSAERSYAIRSVSHEISDGRRVTKWIKLLKSYTKIDVGINRRLQLTPPWRHPIHVLMKQNTNVYWSPFVTDEWLMGVRVMSVARKLNIQLLQQKKSAKWYAFARHWR